MTDGNPASLSTQTETLTTNPGSNDSRQVLSFQETGRPLADIFLAVADRMRAGASLETAVETYHYSKKTFMRLLYTVKESFGIQAELREEPDSLAEFLVSAAETINDNFPLTERALTQGEVPDQPRLQAMVKEMERAWQEKEQLIERIRRQFQGLGREPSEAERFLTRQKEILTSVFKEQNVLLPPEEIERLVVKILDQGRFPEQEAAILAEGNSILREELEEISLPKARTIIALDRIEEAIARPDEQSAAILPPGISKALSENPKFIREASLAMAACYPGKKTPAAVFQETATPSLAILLEKYQKSLGLSPEQTATIPDLLVTLATPALEQMTPNPAEIRALAKASVQEAVLIHFEELGLDPKDNSVKRGAQAVTEIMTMPQTPVSLAFTQARQKVPPPTEREKTLAVSPITSLYPIFTHPFHQGSLAAQLTLLPSNKLQRLQQFWQGFSDYLGTVTTRQPASSLLYLGNAVFSQTGIIDTIKTSPLYQIASPAIAWLEQRSEGRLLQMLAQTSVGKAVKSGLQKVETRLAEWAVKKVVAKLGEEGAKKIAELLIGEGLQVAIATAFNLPGWAVLLILKGAQLLWGVGKKVIHALRLSQALDNFNKLFSLGLAQKTADFVNEKLKFIPGFARGFFNLLAKLGEPVIELGFLLPIFIGVFVGIAVYSLFFSGTMNMVMTPPISRGSEQGVSEGEIADMLPFETDDGFCAGLPDQSAKVACSLLFVLRNPTCQLVAASNEVFVTGNNTSNVAACLQASTTLRERGGDPQYISDVFYNSAHTYNSLQCVGFKRAVEPSLPSVGDAKDYLGHCRHIYSPGENIDNADIQIGDNAVWSDGSFGHIAILIGVNKPNGEVQTAQAWGGSGRINFKTVPVASIGEIIRCP